MYIKWECENKMTQSAWPLGAAKEQRRNKQPASSQGKMLLASLFPFLPWSMEEQWMDEGGGSGHLPLLLAYDCLANCNCQAKPGEVQGTTFGMRQQITKEQRCSLSFRWWMTCSLPFLSGQLFVLYSQSAGPTFFLLLAQREREMKSIFRISQLILLIDWATCICLSFTCKSNARLFSMSKSPREPREAKCTV